MENNEASNVSSANTLSGFMKTYLKSHKLSIRGFARKADVSEGAIRNILKWGNNDKARDPDPWTLIKAARGMKINPVILFELAGYLMERASDNSPYAKYLADEFDNASPETKEEMIRGLSSIVSQK